MRLLRGFGRRVVVRVGRWVWMVVRFVCVIRVPVCARVSRVCPVCVPAPPGIFLPVGNCRCELHACARSRSPQWQTEIRGLGPTRHV